MSKGIDMIDDDPDPDGFDDDYEWECWECGGDGWGILGETFSNDDPVNEPDGQVVRCPNCRGSGLAKDCWYW